MNFHKLDEAAVVGVWVSGGIDSALTLKFVHRHMMFHNPGATLLVMHTYITPLIHKSVRDLCESLNMGLNKGLRVVLKTLRPNMPNIEHLADDTGVQAGVMAHYYWDGIMRATLKAELRNVKGVLPPPPLGGLTRQVSVVHHPDPIASFELVDELKIVVVGTTNKDERKIGSNRLECDVEPLWNLDRTEVFDEARKIGVSLSILNQSLRNAKWEVAPVPEGGRLVGEEDERVGCG